jgi:hypothetical protein
VPAALAELGACRALVVQAIEGSDEAPLDGNSALVWVSEEGEVEEFRISPESVGLSRATKAHIPWSGPEDEARLLLNTLDGEEGPVRYLILYNAALRLWVGDGNTPLSDHLWNGHAWRSTLGAHSRFWTGYTGLSALPYRAPFPYRRRSWRVTCLTIKRRTCGLLRSLMAKRRTLGFRSSLMARFFFFKRDPLGRLLRRPSPVRGGASYSTARVGPSRSA